MPRLHFQAMDVTAFTKETSVFLGAMSTEEVLPVLEKIASRNPFRKTFYRDNDGNITYADNSDFEYPLRDLAKEEVRKIRAGSY